MGANFIYATCPRIDPLPERLQELHRLADLLTPADREEIIEALGCEEADIPQALRSAFDELVHLDLRRDVSTIERPGRQDWITGGMSWGDAPTDAMRLFAWLMVHEPIASKLEAWAVADCQT